MKKILITGKDSYIGSNLIKWLEKEEENFYCEELDVKGNEWKNFDFSSFDVVFHVAGIAHIKETKENKHLYYKVNRDLAYEIAKKTKLDGVKQFIFLSSMSVYGVETGIIDENTQIEPKNAYGKSKLEAENLIVKLQSNSFIVSILRPPMVYGKGCKGNYPRLSRMARLVPVFPKVNNKRSMIYIDNLADYIITIININKTGVYLPQNAEYVNTSELVKKIAKIHNKKVYLTTMFNPLLRLANINIVKKVFGNLNYKKDVASNIDTISFEESLQLTESDKE